MNYEQRTINYDNKNKAKTNPNKANFKCALLKWVITRISYLCRAWFANKI